MKVESDLTRRGLDLSPVGGDGTVDRRPRDVLVGVGEGEVEVSGACDVAQESGLEPLTQLVVILHVDAAGHRGEVRDGSDPEGGTHRGHRARRDVADGADHRTFDRHVHRVVTLRQNRPLSGMEVQVSPGDLTATGYIELSAVLNMNVLGGLGDDLDPDDAGSPTTL